MYNPRGESPGYVTFPVAAMTEVAGRPIFAALLMLLSAERLFTLPDKQRLPAVLAESRKYQSTVQVPVNLATIDWIWDEMLRLYGGHPESSDRFRPTPPERLEKFKSRTMLLTFKVD